MTVASDLESPIVFEGTDQNFEALVLDNSGKGPVLVNYWSPKAGPCLRLYPLLDKLAHEFGGKFLLVNVNTDEQRAAVREYGVASVPTLKLFRYRQVVETAHGYQPENDLRALLNKHVVRDTDAALANALRIYRDGDSERGMMLLAEAAMEDPADMRIPLTLAKLLMREQRAGKAHRLLSTLPEEKRAIPEVRDLLAHVGFMRAAREAPDRSTLEQTVALEPTDLEARYQLAALKLVDDDYEGAMAQLLEIMRHGRQFREDVGRCGLLAIFGILGDEGSLVERYRSLMTDLVE